MELPLGQMVSRRDLQYFVQLSGPPRELMAKKQSRGHLGRRKRGERIFTYAELARQVNRCANALKSLGLNTGDRVTIYLPKIPEQIVAMLACARIGLIHSVVYSGFSAPALESRIKDAEARLIITADYGYDRGKPINLKTVVDQAVANCPTIETSIVVRREKPGIALTDRELDWKNGSRVTPRSAKPNPWIPKPRCTFSTRPARRENLKGWYTSTADTWSARISPRNTSSI